MNPITISVLIILLMGLSLLIFILTFISCIISIIRGGKFMEYIYNKDYKKWEYLTTITTLGSGNVNPFRSIPYLYSDKKSTDKKFQELRLKAKYWTTLSLLGFVSILILVFSIRYLMNLVYPNLV